MTDSAVTRCWFFLACCLSLCEPRLETERTARHDAEVRRFGARIGGKQAAVSGRGAEHTGTPGALQSSLRVAAGSTSATAGARAGTSAAAFRLWYQFGPALVRHRACAFCGCACVPEQT